VSFLPQAPKGRVILAKISNGDRRISRVAVTTGVKRHLAFAPGRSSAGHQARASGGHRAVEVTGRSPGGHRAITVPIMKAAEKCPWVGFEQPHPVAAAVLNVESERLFANPDF
jgi:hypothetical protein